MAKILIADDDEKLRLLIQTTLVDSGHTILNAADGMEAVRLARSEKPQLLLLDLIMPKMQGYEVCKLIRTDPDPEINGIKIIVISVKSYPVDQKVAKELGVDLYLIKPFNRQQLRNAVRKLLH